MSREISCITTIGSFLVGIFKTISGFDNVALSIQAIVDELQRPYNATDDIFSVRYIDLWTENLILTLSMPIKPYVGGTPQFVGAMGIDVTDIRSKNLIEGRRVRFSIISFLSLFVDYFSLDLLDIHLVSITMDN